MQTTVAHGMHAEHSRLRGAAGKAKYDAKKHALVWKIKRFTGSLEQVLVANVELIATTKEKKPWSRPPISLNFQVHCIFKRLPDACKFQLLTPVPQLCC